MLTIAALPCHGESNRSSPQRCKPILPPISASPVPHDQACGRTRMASAPSLQMSWLSIQKRKGGPLGLKNLGNSCYLNSVLQCLTYTPPLANFCLLNHHSSSCTSGNGGGNSSCPFCLVERRISRSLTVDLVADSPARIHSCLSLFAKHFRIGCQEDAHEFLRYVIEACNSVCVKLHKLLSVTKLRSRQDNYKGSKEEPRTIVKEIFGGVLQSQVKCLSCSAESNKLDDIMDLSLDVLQIGSLKEAMCRYFQPEVLDGNNKYKCEKCKKLSAARKQMSIFQAPNVLVIQMKRFENIHGGKIDRYISFEERLELVGHMCRASEDPRPEYILYGVIVHAGYSQASGHYYSYVKDANGKWFCCNDAQVTAVSSQLVLQEKAYILFYVRKNVRLKAKDYRTPQNGHVPSSFAAQAQPALLEVEQVSAKENLPLGKCSPVNTSPLSTNKVEDAQLVKFNLSKAGVQGQTRKLFSNVNGGIGRSPLSCKIANEFGKPEKQSCSIHLTSSENLKNAENSCTLVNGDSALQKQGPGNLQAGNSNLMQHAVETACSGSDETEESTHYIKDGNCQKQEAASRRGSNKFIEISESIYSHSERNALSGKTNGRGGASNGHVGSLEDAEELVGLRGDTMTQQKQLIIQTSGGNIGEGSDIQGCRKGQIDLRSREGETRGQTYGGKKRKALDGPLCLNSGVREGEHIQRHTCMDVLCNDSSCQQYPVHEVELQILKLGLATDSREQLYRSGWCDTVRDCFRAVKRERLLQESWSTDVRKEILRYTLYEPPCSGRYSGVGAHITHRRLPLHIRLLGRFWDSSWEVDGWQRARNVSIECPAWVDTSHSYVRFCSQTSADTELSASVLPDHGFKSRPPQYNCLYPWA